MPAIVALADRDDVDVFCVHDTVVDPEPVPLVGDTVSHDPLPLADQLPPVQPDGDPVTVTVCDPDAEVGATELGVIEKLVHVGAAGSGNDATFCFAPAETGQRQSVSN